MATSPHAPRKATFVSGLRGFMFDDFVSAQIDANVLGGPLRSGGREYAWGFGVHALHLLEFELPPMARRVETSVGLDHAAGSGGCAQGRIETSASGASSDLQATTRASPLLLGSDQAPSPLHFAIPNNASGPSRVRFIADPGVSERPRSADPFEVQDFVDWLEPLIILDGDLLTRAVRQSLVRSMPQLQAWKVEGEWQRKSQWRPGGRPVPGFRREIVLSSQPLFLSQSVAIEKAHSRLVVCASLLPGKSAPVQLQIRIDGKQLARLSVPVLDVSDRAAPIVVDFAAYTGRRVTVELEFRGQQPGASFELPSATLTAD
jgi:NPCBM/NEW2 domain-containing protein